ncbi:MAG: hypothetical protein ABI325_02865 [Ginsengibacter sp.]
MLRFKACWQTLLVDLSPADRHLAESFRTKKVKQQPARFLTLAGSVFFISIDAEKRVNMAYISNILSGLIVIAMGMLSMPHS